MNDFKVGDKVICVLGYATGIESLVLGREYTITYADEVNLVKVDGYSTVWPSYRFIKKEEQQMQQGEQATKWIFPTKQEDWDNVLEVTVGGQPAKWWQTRIGINGCGVVIVELLDVGYIHGYSIKGLYDPSLKIKVPVKKVRIPFDPKHPKLAEATLYSMYYKSSVGSIKVAEYHVFADGHVAIRTEQKGMLSSSMFQICPESYNWLEMEIEE